MPFKRNCFDPEPISFYRNDVEEVWPTQEIIPTPPMPCAKAPSKKYQPTALGRLIQSQQAKKR